VDGLNKDKKEFIKSSSKVSFKSKDTLEEYVKQSENLKESQENLNYKTSLNNSVNNSEEIKDIG